MAKTVNLKSLQIWSTQNADNSSRQQVEETREIIINPMVEPEEALLNICTISRLAKAKC